MADQSVSHEDVRASKVTGTNVYNREGDHLGSVDDIIIGKRDGKVRYAILSFGGFLGIGEEYHPMPWAELDYSEDLSGFVVNRSREELERAPALFGGNGHPAEEHRNDDRNPSEANT